MFGEQRRMQKQAEEFLADNKVMVVEVLGRVLIDRDTLVAHLYHQLKTDTYLSLSQQEVIRDLTDQLSRAEV